MSVRASRKQRLKKLATAPFVVVAAMVLWVEVWLWEYVKLFTACLSRLRGVRAYEAWLANLPPYPTFLAFLLPGLALLPVKIAALWLMAHGSYAGGFSLIVAAKLLGTAVAARTFIICRPKLLGIPWFAWAYHRFLRIKRALYTYVAGMLLIKKARLCLRWLRQGVKQLLVRFLETYGQDGVLIQRWRAVRRRYRNKRTSGQ